MISSCKLDPACNYCSYASTRESVRRERDELTVEELERSVRLALRHKEITSLTLVGGSDLKGLDAVLLQRVEAVRKLTDIEISIDVGAPISIETLEILKENNVTTVYSSLETANRSVFHDAKPGDSFESRTKLLEDLERLGMNIGTVIMNGLGTADDVRQTIKHFRQFKRLKYLFISTFTPVKGTPWELRAGASIRDSLRYIQEARVLFPQVHLGLADVELEYGSLSDLIQEELESGAGNVLTGMLIYKNRTADYVKNMQKLERLGYHIITRNES